MDKTEVVTAFRAAKNKREQVEILADLNCCAPREIAKLLDELGELGRAGLRVKEFSARYVPVQGASEDMRRNIGPGRGRKPSFDRQRAAQMYCEGVPVREIALEVGTTPKLIYSMASHLKLSRPFVRVGKTEKEETDMQQKRTVEDEAVARADDLTAREAEIIESVDAGSRPHIRLEQPPATVAPPRETMTVGGFVNALGRYLTEAVADAELRINGTPISADLSLAIAVRNERVFVDLGTRGAG